METLWVVVFVVNVAVVCGIKYDGLRVKFGWASALADAEYFYRLPRTMAAAEAAGWARTERPPGPMPELRLYCARGRVLCPLYDASGSVAGLQIALPVETYENAAARPEQLQYVKWRPPAAPGEPPREYWAFTQFYVSEESLKAGTGPQPENGETLQDGGVWVRGADGRLLRIPSTEMELNTTAFKKQNCIPNMGTHYYYNMTPAMKCEAALPWFALVTQGELVGTGFQVFGRLRTPPLDKQQWFEAPPTSRRATKMVAPRAPACVHEWAATHGLISLHIYYVDEPWQIRCGAGDSVQPLPVFDRFALNGYRYASQLADHARRIMSALAA